MFNAKQLLDAMVGSSALGGKSGKSGFGSAQGGLGGMLGDVLGSITKGKQPGAPGQPPTQTGQQGSFSGGLDDAIARITGGRGGAGNDLFNRAKDFAGTPQGAAVLAGLGGLLLKSKGRSIMGSAAKVGGLALVGGLAYTAWKNWQGNQPATASAEAQTPLPPPAESAFSAEKTSDETALVLARAMIAAANADGHVDETERSRIIGGLEQVGLDPDATRFLDQEFARPASAEDLAAASTGPETAAEIYTAARLAIDPDTPREKAFLARLANALKLDPGLVAHIDAAAGSAKA